MSLSPMDQLLLALRFYATGSFQVVVWNKYFSLVTGRQVVTLLPVLLHPRSKGTVKLKSKDPAEPPLIDPQYLSRSDEVKALIRGIRLVEKLVDAMPGAALKEHPMPGCDHLKFSSDGYWECYIRHLTLTAYHPCCSAAMEAVVNPSLRVHHTNHLYVVDASVMSSLTSGNINAAVLMIAEKAADMILEVSASEHATCYIKHIFLNTKVTCNYTS